MKQFFTALLIFFCTSAFAQVAISDAEMLFLSRNVWRGTQLGNAPAIEPSVTVSKGNFSINFWAAQTLNDSYTEIDLIPSYQVGEIALTLFDYYVPEKGENNDFLNFKEGEGRHTLEFSLDNYSGEMCPLKWMVGTFFAGDKNEETGKTFYSTYVEFKYPFRLWKIDAEPFVGLTPFKGYYADKFAFINSGLALSKDIKLAKKLACPLNLTYTYNPYADKHFVTFGLGIALSGEE